MLPGVERRETGKLFFNGYRVSVWDDEIVLEIDNADDCATV